MLFVFNKLMNKYIYSVNCRFMMYQKYSNCFLVIGFCLTIFFSASSFVGNSFGSMDELSESTSGGSLDVNITSFEVINKDKEVKFKINFLEPNTDKIQVHVDYDFQVLQNGKEIFSAAKQINQPLLHTA